MGTMRVGLISRVRHVVMALDVIEIDRLGDAGLLIQIHQITLQIWVIDDAPQIALEMPVINDVEPDERAEKSPIGFDDAVDRKENDSSTSVAPVDRVPRNNFRQATSYGR